MNISQKHIGIGSMILSGFFFGGVWFFGKMVVQDISPLMFTLLRMSVALVVLLVIGYQYIPKVASVHQNDRKKIMVASVVGMVGMAICFTLSIKYTTVINSSFLFFLPAVLFPIFGSIFGGIQLKYTTYIAVALSIFGLYFLFQPDIVGTSFVGNMFGLFAGIFNVIYIASIKSVSHVHPRVLGIAVFGVLVGVLFVLTWLFEGLDFSQVSSASREFLGYIGACIAGAYFFLNIGVKHISSYLAGILVIREPIAATFLGVMFLGELLTYDAVIGLTCILIGFGLISLDKSLVD